MKKLILLLALLSAAQISIGQKITRAEYFIDTDPGFGKANNITISTPATDLSLSFNVNLSSLAEGFHVMVLRARNDKGFGVWRSNRSSMCLNQLRQPPLR